MIQSLCVMIRQPKGVEASSLGIRTAWAVHTAGLEAHLVLLDDGVFTGLDNPGYNSSLMKDLLKEDGRVSCLAKSLAERGLRREDLLEGIEVIEDDDVAETIQEAEGVLSF